MNFKLELPEGTILVKRTDLKEVFQEMLSELQNTPEKEEIMTIREAADYLKVSIPTIRNMIAKQEIPYFQRGQVIRINRNDLKNWLRSNSKK